MRGGTGTPADEAGVSSPQAPSHDYLAALEDPRCQYLRDDEVIAMLKNLLTLLIAGALILLSALEIVYTNTERAYLHWEEQAPVSE